MVPENFILFTKYKSTREKFGILEAVESNEMKILEVFQNTIWNIPLISAKFSWNAGVWIAKEEEFIEKW